MGGKRLKYYLPQKPREISWVQKTFNKFSTDYEIMSFRDLTYDIPDCDETGTTFGENAHLKVCNARQYLRGADKNLASVCGTEGRTFKSYQAHHK